MASEPTKAKATVPPIIARPIDAVSTESLSAKPSDATAHRPAAKLISLRGPKWSVSMPTGNWIDT